MINVISKQAGMKRFRGVIVFVLFVASILKMRFTICLNTQSIHQRETTFLIKCLEMLIKCLEMRDNL